MCCIDTFLYLCSVSNKHIKKYQQMAMTVSKTQQTTQIETKTTKTMKRATIKTVKIQESRAGIAKAQPLTAARKFRGSPLLVYG